MSEPLAFLLTFRTYGTWLHGDERGSVDREHNTPGTPMLPADAGRELRERRAMKTAALVLDERMRAVVDAAIVDQCRYRRWELRERAVQTNHAHVVVGYAGVQAERMMQQFKARATRWLRERGLVGPRQPVWVDGPGSRRYVWTPEQVNAAIAYVREGQDVPR